MIDRSLDQLRYEEAIEDSAIIQLVVKKYPSATLQNGGKTKEVFRSHTESQRKRRQLVLFSLSNISRAMSDSFNVNIEINRLLAAQYEYPRPSLLIMAPVR